MTEAETTTPPRIYVACLAAYNNGQLHGGWLNLNDYSDIDELMEAVQKILRESPIPGAEEWAIHDFEGFYGYPLHEYDGLENVLTLAQHIHEHGEPYVLYCKNLGQLADVDDFEEAYVGEYDSEVDYARETFDELHSHEIPEALRNYFDYEAYARDLFINDYFSMDSETRSKYIYRYT